MYENNHNFSLTSNLNVIQSSYHAEPIAALLYVVLQRCECVLLSQLAFVLHGSCTGANLSAKAPILLRNHSGPAWASTKVVEAQNISFCFSFKILLCACASLLLVMNGSHFYTGVGVGGGNLHFPMLTRAWQPVSEHV